MADMEVEIKLNDRVSNKLKNIDRAGRGLSKTLLAAGAAAAAFASISIVKGVVSQYTAYEKYRTVLTTFLGSQKAANKELARLQKLASGLPDDLSDLTGAFTIFTRNGLDTSTKSLTAFSNIANANGKSIIQLAEAVADGMTGEFERYKEFGIKVSKEGDKLVARIGTQTVAIGKSATEITNKIRDLGSTGMFAGAAAANANTLGQSFSNLRDAVFKASIAFGEALAPNLKLAVDQATKFLSVNEELIKSLGAGTGEAIRLIADAAKALANNFDLITAAIQALLFTKVLGFMAGLLGQMRRNTAGAKTMTGMMSGLTKAIVASGTASVVAVGRFSGLNKIFSAMTTTVGRLAGGIGLLSFSSDLNAGELEEPIYKFINGLGDAEQAMAKFGGTKSELSALTEQYNELVKGAISYRDALDGTTTNGKFEYDNITKSIKAYSAANSDAATRAIADAIEVTSALSGAGDIIDEVNDKQLSYMEQIASDRAEQLKNILDLQNALSGENKMVSTLAKTYGLSEAQISEAMNKRLASLIEIRDLTKEVGEQSADSSNTVKDFATDLESRFKNLSGSMTSTFMDMFTGIKSGFEGLKDIAKMVLGQIMEALIQVMIVKPIIDGMTGGLGSIFGGFFADGGRVNSSSKPIIVGEKGPEVFMPNGAGQVIPNDALGGGGGGEGNLNVTFEINAMDTQTGVEFLLKNKSTIEGVIQGAYNKRGKAGPLG